MIIELKLSIILSGSEVPNKETLGFYILINPESLRCHVQVANTNIKLIAKEWS
ncbi:hypothetical protein D3C81_2236140 [compost metagenome]